jgi:hypothetical protein
MEKPKDVKNGEHNLFFFSLFSVSFCVSVETVSAEFQMKMIQLQRDEDLFDALTC